MAWSPKPAALRFVRRRRHVRLQQLGGAGEGHPLKMMREFIARSRGGWAAATATGVGAGVPTWATAGNADRASWQVHTANAISNYGKGYL